MWDIFDGKMLQNFKGPDNRHFVYEEDEGRYAFLLSIDFFNPLLNKQSWKKVCEHYLTSLSQSTTRHMLQA